LGSERAWSIPGDCHDGRDAHAVNAASKLGPHAAELRVSLGVRQERSTYSDSSAMSTLASGIMSFAHFRRLPNLLGRAAATATAPPPDHLLAVKP
jgi:hypothetical protein